MTGDDFIARLLRHLKTAAKNTAQPVSARLTERAARTETDIQPMQVQLNPPCLRYLIEKLRDLEQQYSAGLRPYAALRHCFRTPPLLPHSAIAVQKASLSVLL